MTVGYARVSIDDQTHALQEDALEQAGYKQAFTDTISGVKAERPGLVKALRFLPEGDTLVVWRLDRLGRFLKYLIEVMTQFSERRIGRLGLTEQIDTTTSGGKLIFHGFGTLGRI